MSFFCQITSCDERNNGRFLLGASSSGSEPEFVNAYGAQESIPGLLECLQIRAKFPVCLSDALLFVTPFWDV